MPDSSPLITEQQNARPAIHPLGFHVSKRIRCHLLDVVADLSGLEVERNLQFRNASIFGSDMIDAGSFHLQPFLVSNDVLANSDFNHLFDSPFDGCTFCRIQVVNWLDVAKQHTPERRIHVHPPLCGGG